MEQIERAVAIGVLAPGQQLPTVKQISSDLIINPSTVSRALRELEHSGVVESIPGRGSFVSGNGVAKAAQRAAADTVASALDAAVREARSLGVDAAAVTAAFESARDRWFATTRTPENRHDA
jgi:GntR family transcriptional regulator